MDEHYSHAVQLLLAGLYTRLVAAALEPPAAGLHEQLARLLVELSETDELVPHRLR
ncbi:hypothetical protein [Streptomyces violascens]|uniref:Uncharacterized protein n=1 Tax=Streptomyces violascens TaxID=67381 RepID=A0ABQ3QWM7_9ACTN|nr:hypothetical protein [Streptomyces violascens]GGU11752.1 hypothetical protein GCM10010289_36330 [Streptomyces violascens]GHI41684.1 hypothetical protein Sviol_60920 [Streptomyces violascens]